MPGGSGSFLRDVTRDVKIQKQVLPTLQQLGGGLGSMAPTYRPQAPASAPQSAPAPESVAAPAPEAALGAAQQAVPPLSIEGAPVPAPEPVAEPVDTESFYRLTGRRPGAAEVKMLEARQRFLTARGRMPTPKELMFEVQRGFANTGTSIEAGRLD